MSREGWLRAGLGVIVVGHVVGGLAVGRRLVPDVALYEAQSGSWFFPSPGGRILGRLGALEVAALVGGIAIAWWVARQSSSTSRSAILLMSPPAFYLGSLGVAVPALALSLWGRGVLGALVHPATGLAMPGRSRWFAGGVAIALLVTTPYVASGDPTGSGLAVAIGVGLPVATGISYVARFERSVVIAAAVGFGLMLVTQDLQMRYLLPAVVLGAAQ